MGRAGKVTSHEWFDEPLIFCPEREKDEYRKHHGEVVGIPGDVRGITPTRNWMIEYAAKNGESRMVMVDDDAKGFYKFEKGKRGVGTLVGVERFGAILSNMFDMTEDLGTNLFGFQVTNDSKTYREYSPFSLQSVIVGNLMGLIIDGQRFDERFVLKEDYDFSMQSLKRHRKVLRNNKFAWWVEHQTTDGGCKAYRTKGMELKMVALLKKKWGTKLVRTHGKKDWECVVRSPIPGI